MGQKRRLNFKNRGQPKRKRINLLTLRQKNDYRQLGEAHPVENSDRVRTYTKVEDRQDHSQPGDESSSDESEHEVPVMKQLMAEIGVKEEAPSDEETDDEDSESIKDKRTDESENSNDDDDDDDDSQDEETEEVNNIEDAAEESEATESEEESANKDHFESSEEIETEMPSKSGKMMEREEEEEEEEEEEVTDAEDNDELSLKESDPFAKHYELDNDISTVAENSVLKWQKNQIKVSGLGESCLLYKDSSFLPQPDTDTDLRKLHVKHKLCSQVLHTNTELAHIHPKSGSHLSHLQHRLFSIINSYQDLLYSKQTVNNLEEIRLVYTLHAVNHVLKTRSRVIAHNAKLKNKKHNADEDVEYRDQGLTRPKVLILLPYRDKALKVVNMIISLLSSSEQVNVSNRKRFESEFSELERSDLAEKKFKPEDFRIIFEGNTDDNFRVGMSVSKKSLRLYSPFYESDIILASPLGLRMVIGLEGDRDRDFDFLSSIEVLIVDQTDIFLMQNWDHFTHVFKHLHLQPKEYHNVDFSRVRMWSINGWNKYYRQTLLFSSVLLPEILTIFNKQCHNYTGKLLVLRDGKQGAVRSCISDVPQIFHRVACDAPNGLSQRNAKFEYLKKKIIPYHTSAGMKHTLIYCNYYSFVHLRNYFREAEMDFLFINEYDTERHIRNARIHFRKRHPHFMLYTERLHFHYRFRLRGIHHIVWFDLPQYPHYYPELVNLMETTHQACTNTVLFTRYDAQKLTEIVGMKQATHMLNSNKSVNMITVS